MSPVGVLSEDALELAALGLLSEMGWETVDAYSEHYGSSGTLGRDNPGEVILVERFLRPALERLNPELPSDAIAGAIELLTADLSALGMIRANRKMWALMRGGVDVEVRDDESGQLERVRVRVIDWNTPANNSFMAVKQFWVTGEMYTRRADIVGFVNGLPLVFIELKASHKRLRDAFDHNLTDYKSTVPHLFWANGLVILSNGSRSRMGSLSAGWEHFAEWKRVSDEGEPPQVSLEVMLRGVCDPSRLLDLVENFTAFQEMDRGLVKIIAKNHQVLGVNAALQSLIDSRERDSGPGRLGVFWHTQGSGKSLSMLFFCEKVHRKLAGNWTFVVVTDRRDLDDQIYRNFHSCGVLTRDQVQADSIAGLRELLSADERYVFTLIHKFGTRLGEKPPVLSDRSDVVVITDEAHRTQYDRLAYNMRIALPNASFLGFTGTPLIVGEEKTKETFGDYVSVYDFKESIADGATVPLFYENRTPELELDEAVFDSGLDAFLEAAELDDDAEHSLARKYGREYQLITRKDRLAIVAGDIVNHFLGRGFAGKAMMVSIDKQTAVRMYDLVQAEWERRLEALRTELNQVDDDPDRAQLLRDQIDYMAETDMAVVVSQGQNEIADMAKVGLDIVPHRKRMIEENLEEKFKDPDDPLRIGFVCAMWMTGFDAPATSTVYLDKPMRNHTLMQTIARANRVWRDKTAGTIVDYVGIFRNLQKALAIYAAGPGEAAGESLPIGAKEQLRDALIRAIDEVRQYLAGLGIDLNEAEASQEQGALAFIAARDDAVNAIRVNDDTQREFLGRARRVDSLLRALLPDPSAEDAVGTALVIRNIADTVRNRKPKVDLSALHSRIEEMLNNAVTALDYSSEPDEQQVIDLSFIDFEDLAEKFNKSDHKNTEAERLRQLINGQLGRMIEQNPTRIDLMERFQELIADYNAGSQNVEELFEALVALSKEMTEEEQRAARENLNDEELAVFDLLTRPEPTELTEAEKSEVKASARDLLAKLKSDCLVLDWRHRQRTRAAVRVAIGDVLDEELPDTYGTKLFETKCDLIYHHVYDSYYGDGASIYEEAA